MLPTFSKNSGRFSLDSVDGQNKALLLRRNTDECGIAQAHTGTQRQPDMH